MTSRTYGLHLNTEPGKAGIVLGYSRSVRDGVGISGDRPRRLAGGELGTYPQVPGKRLCCRIACREDTMLEKFGKPGELTDRCSAITGNVRRRIEFAVDVGPFKVSGLDFAVASLGQIFQVLSREHPDTYNQIKTAGIPSVLVENLMDVAFRASR